METPMFISESQNTTLGKASLVLTLVISSSYSKLSVMAEVDHSFSLRAVSMFIGQRHKWAGIFPLGDMNRGRI